MNFSKMCELFKKCQALSKVLLGKNSIAHSYNIGSSPSSTTVNTVDITAMDKVPDIEKIWSCINDDIPVSMPNSKNICWLHASKEKDKEKDIGDYFHFGQYFCTDKHTPDNIPLHFWIGVVHYEIPNLDGVYIWLFKESGRTKQPSQQAFHHDEGFYIPININCCWGLFSPFLKTSLKTTIQQMLIDLFG